MSTAPPHPDGYALFFTYYEDGCISPRRGYPPGTGARTPSRKGVPTKAWQFEGAGKPLALNEVEEPTAGPGEVVVDVKAAGVCHSDVSALDDEGWMALVQNSLPRTMGHESAGVITEVDEGMEKWSIGDRVGLAPLTSDGSALGTREDLAGIYELMKDGSLNPPINHITHADIPEAVDKLRKGGVIGRFIAMYEE